MSDINKFIRDNGPDATDLEGHRLDLEPWSETEALQRAAAEGIDMTPEHWEVVHFLRERYLQKGQADSGRELVYELEETFGREDGRRHLYSLFPHGPVAQGCRIAGLPLPPYTTDPSFGSAE